MLTGIFIGLSVGVTLGLVLGLILFLMAFSTTSHWTARLIRQSTPAALSSARPPVAAPVEKENRPVRYGPVGDLPVGDLSRQWREQTAGLHGAPTHPHLSASPNGTARKSRLSPDKGGPHTR